MKEEKKLIEKIVNWWAKEVQNDSNQNNGEDGLASLFGSMLRNNEIGRIEKSDIDLFKLNLTKILMEQKVEDIELDVDYNPCCDLIKAIQGTSIGQHVFPWKTRMYISNNEIYVKVGYAQPYKKLS